MPIVRTRLVRGDDIPHILRGRSLGGGYNIRGVTRPEAPGDDKEDKAATEGQGIHVMAEASGRRVHYVGGRMLLPCADGESLLEVLEVGGARGSQGVYGVRTMPAKEFMRGIGRKNRLLINSRE